MFTDKNSPSYVTLAREVAFSHPKICSINPVDTCSAGFFRRRIGADQEGEIVIVLGVVLLVLGLLLPVPPVVTTIGVILLVVGAVLWVLGAAGRPVGGRRYWY